MKKIDDDTLKAHISALLMQPIAARVSSTPKANESKSDARNRYRMEAAAAAWEALAGAEALLEELEKRKGGTCTESR